MARNGGGVVGDLLEARTVSLLIGMGQCGGDRGEALDGGVGVGAKSGGESAGECGGHFGGDACACEER